jgi:NAD(P)-dependent dehydrogenase (short-subunit alcohol dehydrogenase family)
MREMGAGRILNLTSIGGLSTMRGFSAYSASKFALEGWSEALHDEIAPLGIFVTIIEPGGFRTEFSGPKNMRPQKYVEAYRPIIEPIESFLYGSDGKQPGDPRKAAAAMIAVVESAEPPLRLLLGADAIGAWERKRDAVNADLAKWRETAEDTAYDETLAAP